MTGMGVVVARRVVFALGDLQSPLGNPTARDKRPFGSRAPI
jgi:hypothetical protein